MVKTVIIRKRTIFIYGLLVLVLAIGVVVLETFINKSNNDEYITYAQAAKMIAYANVDDAQAFETGEVWYKPYIEYVNINGYMQCEEPDDYIMMKDVYILSKKLNAGDTTFESVGIQSLSQLKNNNRVVTKQEFIDYYILLLPYCSNGQEVEKVELGIAGTPAELNVSEWEMYTTKGKYIFDGIIATPYIDRQVLAIVRDNRLLCIERKISDEVDYSNVWLKYDNNGMLYVNFYGVEKKLKIGKVNDDIDNTLADIHLSKGKVKNISVKKDIIKGKVLSVTNEYVEIDGYGKVPLDEQFIIYDNVSDVKTHNYDEIIVGYSLQRFIVANGKVCGAIIGEELKHDNIRVMLKTTGYKDLFHSSVSMSSDSIIHITCADVQWDIAAGESFDIDSNDERLATGRIVLSTDDGSITINSIKRSQGNPSYKGNIELALYDEGIAVINEIDIEDYLKKVVPSEMPVSFGVNALKCQAVCARSYAYTQLTNNYYSEYGAHIDDSVSFQVYNNTYDSAEADEAVIATAGMVAVYNGELVKTYYYSTSCGYTADVCAWGSDEDNYPQYASVRAGTSDYNADIKSEKTFEQFITAKDSSDYDSEADMYRWKTVIGISELTAHFNSLIGSYLRKNGSVYILENGEPSDKVVNDIGDISSVKVIERGCGGVVAALMVEGSKETCIVKGENAVRSLMGNNKCAIITQSREIYNDILPSAFCIFKPVYDNGTLVSYEITGGGYGHGIGMSQNAVKKMSETMDYTDILKFFYNNIEIKNIND